jgi:hypothetical protein
MVMRKPAVAATVSSEGFLLLDSAMEPIFVNHAAAKALLYPLEVEAQGSLDDFLASKIRCTLLSEQSPGVPSVVVKFQSGRRMYLCRTFRVNAPIKVDSRPSVAVLLERSV